MQILKYFEAWTAEFSLPTIREFLIGIKRKKIKISDDDVPVFLKENFESNIRRFFECDIIDIGNKYYDYAYTVLRDETGKTYVIFFEDDAIVGCVKFQLGSHVRGGILHFEDLVVMYNRRYGDLYLRVFNIYTNDSDLSSIDVNSKYSSQEGGEYQFSCEFEDNIPKKLICRENSSRLISEFEIKDTTSYELLKPLRTYKATEKEWDEWDLPIKEEDWRPIEPPTIYFGCGNCEAEGSVDCEDCGGSSTYECDNCGGDGDCPECDGSGKVTCEVCDGEGEFECETCGGSGVVDDDDCDDCGGEGKHSCSECEGHKEQDCSECDGSGTCSHCGGRGEFDCGSCDGCGKQDCEDCNGSGVLEIDPETMQEND